MRVRVLMDKLVFLLFFYCILGLTQTINQSVAIYKPFYDFQITKCLYSNAYRCPYLIVSHPSTSCGVKLHYVGRLLYKLEA